MRTARHKHLGLFFRQDDPEAEKDHRHRMDHGVVQSVETILESNPGLTDEELACVLLGLLHAFSEDAETWDYTPDYMMQTWTKEDLLPHVPRLRQLVTLGYVADEIEDDAFLRRSP